MIIKRISNECILEVHVKIFISINNIKIYFRITVLKYIYYKQEYVRVSVKYNEEKNLKSILPGADIALGHWRKLKEISTEYQLDSTKWIIISSDVST